jgi:hypothetical protein
VKKSRKISYKLLGSINKSEKAMNFFLHSILVETLTAGGWRKQVRLIDMNGIPSPKGRIKQ